MSWRCGTCGAWLFTELPDEHDFVLALPDVDPDADDIRSLYERSGLLAATGTTGPTGAGA